MHRRTYARFIGVALILIAAGVGASALRPGATQANTSYRTVNLRAETVTQSSITIRWDANLGLSAPVHFLRTTATPDGMWSRRRLSQTEAQDRVLTFSGLRAGTTYAFVIEDCAITCVSSTRLDVTTQQPPPPPAAPTNLHVCGGGSQPEVCQGGGSGILLYWTDNATTEDRYEFQWAMGQPGVLPRASAYTTVMLAADRSRHLFIPPSSGYYYLRVRACNASGCSAFSTTEHTVHPSLSPAP